MSAHKTSTITSGRRSYTEIVRLLVNEAASRLDSQKKPEFTLGPPTKVMNRLAAEHRRATKAINRIEAQLKRRGAQMRGGHLLLHYDRHRQLEQDWNKRKSLRAEKLRSLKTAALVELLGLPPSAARTYLKTLKERLDALITL